MKAVVWRRTEQIKAKLHFHQKERNERPICLERSNSCCFSNILHNTTEANKYKCSYSRNMFSQNDGQKKLNWSKNCCLLTIFACCHNCCKQFVFFKWVSISRTYPVPLLDGCSVPHFQISTVSVSPDRYRASVDHGMSYVFRKLWPTAFTLQLQYVLLQSVFFQHYFSKVYSASPTVDQV